MGYMHTLVLDVLVFIFTRMRIQASEVGGEVGAVSVAVGVAQCAGEASRSRSHDVAAGLVVDRVQVPFAGVALVRSLVVSESEDRPRPHRL